MYIKFYKPFKTSAKLKIKACICSKMKMGRNSDILFYIYTGFFGNAKTSSLDIILTLQCGYILSHWLDVLTQAVCHVERL
jgi:hypothetical protein